MRSRIPAAFGSTLALVALALGGCAAESGDAAGDDAAGGDAPASVDFVLNFTPGPQHEEFVVAEHGGFFEDAGLDVNVTTPADTTDSISLVAGGSADVGLGYAGDVISAQAQGVPVKTVAVIHRRIALGLMSQPDSGIQTPQDLVGKTVGLTMIPANVAMFNAMLEANGIEESQVNVVPVGFNGVQMVASGEVDAADAVAWYEVGLYRQTTGERPSYMEFTDFGAPDGYYLSVITSERYAAEEPETLKAFVGAILDAEKWTMENPDDAHAILLENVEGVTAEFAKDSRGVLETVIADKASQERGLGWSDDAVWQRMVDFYVESGQIEDAVETDSLYSNQFLPDTPVTVAVSPT